MDSTEPMHSSSKYIHIHLGVWGALLIEMPYQVNILLNNATIRKSGNLVSLSNHICSKCYSLQAIATYPEGSASPSEVKKLKAKP